MGAAHNHEARKASRRGTKLLDRGRETSERIEATGGGDGKCKNDEVRATGCVKLSGWSNGGEMVAKLRGWEGG